MHLYPDGRYVAPPGQYRGSQTVDTTYLIREPVNFVLLPPVKHYTPFPTFPHYSLKILRHFKYEKGNNKFDGKWNEISGNDELPMKVKIVGEVEFCNVVNTLLCDCYLFSSKGLPINCMLVVHKITAIKSQGRFVLIRQCWNCNIYWLLRKFGGGFG